MDIAYILALFLAVAVCTDFQKQIIPNELIYIGSTACILSLVSGHEMMGLVRGMTQMMILFVCLFPAYMIKAIGAGDVKLLMMTGLYIPGEKMLSCVFTAFLLGAVLGFFKIICKKFIFVKKHDAAGSSLADNKIHFSLPVLMSVLLMFGR